MQPEVSTNPDLSEVITPETLHAILKLNNIPSAADEKLLQDESKEFDLAAYRVELSENLFLRDAVNNCFVRKQNMGARRACFIFKTAEDFPLVLILQLSDLDADNLRKLNALMSFNSSQWNTADNLFAALIAKPKDGKAKSQPSQSERALSNLKSLYKNIQCTFIGSNSSEVLIPQILASIAGTYYVGKESMLPFRYLPLPALNRPMILVQSCLRMLKTGEQSLMDSQQCDVAAFKAALDQVKPREVASPPAEDDDDAPPPLIDDLAEDEVGLSTASVDSHEPGLPRSLPEVDSPPNSRELGLPSSHRSESGSLFNSRQPGLPSSASSQVDVPVQLPRALSQIANNEPIPPPAVVSPNALEKDKKLPEEESFKDDSPPLKEVYTPEIVHTLLKLSGISPKLDEKLSQDEGGEFDLSTFRLELSDDFFLQKAVDYFFAKKHKPLARRECYIFKTSQNFPLALILQLSSPDAEIARKLSNLLSFNLNKWGEPNKFLAVMQDELKPLPAVPPNANDKKVINSPPPESKRALLDIKNLYKDIRCIFIGAQADQSIIQQIMVPMQRAYSGQVNISFMPLPDLNPSIALVQDCVSILKTGEQKLVSTRDLYDQHQELCRNAVIAALAQIKQQEDVSPQANNLPPVTPPQTMAQRLMRLGKGIFNQIKNKVSRMVFRTSSQEIAAPPSENPPAANPYQQVMQRLTRLARYIALEIGRIKRENDPDYDLVREKEEAYLANINLEDPEQLIQHLKLFNVGGLVGMLQHVDTAHLLRKLGSACDDKVKSLRAWEKTFLANKAQRNRLWDGLQFVYNNTLVDMCGKFSLLTGQLLFPHDITEEFVAVSCYAIGTGVGTWLTLSYFTVYMALSAPVIAFFSNQVTKWVDPYSVDDEKAAVVLHGHAIRAPFADPSICFRSINFAIAVAHSVWTSNPIHIFTSIGGIAGASTLITLVKYDNPKLQLMPGHKFSPEQALTLTTVSVVGSMVGQRWIGRWLLDLSMQRQAQALLVEHIYSFEERNISVIKSVETPNLLTHPWYWFDDIPVQIKWWDHNNDLYHQDCKMVGLDGLACGGVTVDTPIFNPDASPIHDAESFLETWQRYKSVPRSDLHGYGSFFYRSRGNELWLEVLAEEVVSTPEFTFK